VVSDDTQLTAATCEAVTACKGRVDPAMIAESFRRWYEDGRLTGLGSSTLKALRDLSFGAHWALAGARGEFAAGAGAAMRIAPLAFLLDPTVDKDRATVRDVTRITHNNDEAYAGALAVVLAIREGMSTEGALPGLLSRILPELPDTAVRDRVEELSAFEGTILQAQQSFGNTGHVVDAVPMALFIASRTGAELESAIESAIRGGGDTDTVAAITAQVCVAAGAACSEELWALLSQSRELDLVFGDFVQML
jgi:ADP-ribosylglycohydrolase